MITGQKEGLELLLIRLGGRGAAEITLRLAVFPVKLGGCAGFRRVLTAPNPVGDLFMPSVIFLWLNRGGFIKHGWLFTATEREPPAFRLWFRFRLGRSRLGCLFWCGLLNLLGCTLHNGSDNLWFLLNLHLGRFHFLFIRLCGRGAVAQRIAFRI